MSRLVRFRPNLRASIPGRAACAKGRRARLRQAAIAPDNYLERIAKYVPVEVLLLGLHQRHPRSGDAERRQRAHDGRRAVITIAIIAFVAGMLAAPFFVWYIHNEGDAWVTNAIMCLLAFPFWSCDGAVASPAIATAISPRSCSPPSR